MRAPRGGQVAIVELCEAMARVDLGSGDATFTSNAAVNAIADSMLGSLGNGGFNGYSQLLGLTNGEYQDQLIVVPGVGAFAGLGGLVAIRRRRRRA